MTLEPEDWAFILFSEDTNSTPDQDILEGTGQELTIYLELPGIDREFYRAYMLTGDGNSE